MNNFFDNQRIFDIIWRRKIHFMIVGFIAVLLAAVFSGPFFIKPKYRSVTRIYPSNIWSMSEESRSEQMLEIIDSRDIKERVIKAFQLDKVYKIDRDDPAYMTNLLGKYDKYINTSKTKFETIEIKVLDNDPQRASDLCDSIIHFYNKKVREMHKAKDWEMVELMTKNLNKKYVELDTVVTKLDIIRNDYGILDYKTQAERVTEGLMNALAGGRATPADTRKIQDLYNNLAEKGIQARLLEAQFNLAVRAIDSLRRLRDIHIAEFEKDITYAHIVEHPVPADKKSYPVRWVIVAFSAFSAVFLALLVFLLLDYRREVLQ